MSRLAVYILAAYILQSSLRNCVKVEVAVLGSRPSLTKPTVSVDVKQHSTSQLYIYLSILAVCIYTYLSIWAVYIHFFLSLSLSLYIYIYIYIGSIHIYLPIYVVSIHIYLIKAIMTPRSRREYKQELWKSGDFERHGALEHSHSAAPHTGLRLEKANLKQQVSE